MNPDITNELTKALRKLYTLEDSIIHENKMDSRDLRSKQALLLSEVIQSLQELESTIKKESFFAIPSRENTVIRA